MKADESLAELNTINLSFPDLDESIEIDKYRLFSIERFKNNFIMFAAYYSDQGSVDDNIGQTMLIWVGKDIGKATKLADLKANKKVKTFFWDSVDHYNDDIIPSFRT